MTMPLEPELTSRRYELRTAELPLAAASQSDVTRPRQLTIGIVVSRRCVAP